MHSIIFEEFKKSFVVHNKTLPFSCTYDGKPFAEIDKTVSVLYTKGDSFLQETIICQLTDGLKTETIMKYYPKYGAFDWVTWFENTGKEDSRVLSEIKDCSVKMPFDNDPAFVSGAFLPHEDTLHIYVPNGSTNSRTEYANRREHLMPGNKRNYKTSGGRSSNSCTPFFDINRRQRGYIAAIGWTGQWNVDFERDEKTVTMHSGLETAAFKLHPGERVRTTSTVIMPYENGQNNGHNAWRRLIKEQFSLVGKPGRDTEGPLMTAFWGGLHSEHMIERLNYIAKNNLHFDYVWVDAGWYGHSTEQSLNEFEGDWPEHTGSWVINKAYHPNGMKDVAKIVSDYGMKYMLWVEPERCRTGTDMVSEHPTWFLKCEETEKSKNWLLDLGNPEACQGAIDLISGLISDLNLGCYRQDFNMSPLPYWHANDEEERVGIKEIKHIMGLYHFWDTLLEKYPHLMIDNCSSGGKRIDIETLRRSFPMWRSDSQCYVNMAPETTQAQQSSISWWIPYSGTGAGIEPSMYSWRSCYAPSLMGRFWWCNQPCFDFDDNNLDFIRKVNAEYRRVRPFLSEDYYPLVQSAQDDSNWSASQYHRPTDGAGLVLVFRRPKALCDRAVLPVEGFDEEKSYLFIDADTQETFTFTGAELLEKGLTLEMPEKRSSKLLFYTEIK